MNIYLILGIIYTTYTYASFKPSLDVLRGPLLPSSAVDPGHVPHTRQSKSDALKLLRSVKRMSENDRYTVTCPWYLVAASLGHLISYNEYRYPVVLDKRMWNWVLTQRQAIDVEHGRDSYILDDMEYKDIEPIVGAVYADRSLLEPIQNAFVPDEKYMGSKELAALFGKCPPRWVYPLHQFVSSMPHARWMYLWALNLETRGSITIVDPRVPGHVVQRPIFTLPRMFSPDHIKVLFRMMGQDLWPYVRKNPHQSEYIYKLGERMYQTDEDLSLVLSQVPRPMVHDRAALDVLLNDLVLAWLHQPAYAVLHAIDDVIADAQRMNLVPRGPVKLPVFDKEAIVAALLTENPSLSKSDLQIFLSRFYCPKILTRWLIEASQGDTMLGGVVQSAVLLKWIDSSKPRRRNQVWPEPNTMTRPPFMPNNDGVVVKSTQF